MFERFTGEARRVVVRALEIAAEDGDPLVRTPHMLLAVAEGDDLAARVLRTYDIEPETLRRAAAESAARGGLSDDDVAALEEIGVDVDGIIERVESSFGPGALARAARRGARGNRRFDAAAKKVLGESVKEVARTGNRRLGAEHILLALAADPDAGRLLALYGAEEGGLRARIEAA